MSQRTRALLIGMIGPVLQAIGVTWDLLEHAVLERNAVGHLTLTHILTGPPHLIIFTGFALSLFCIPIALQVAAARPEELEWPQPEPEARDKFQPTLGPAEATK